MKEGTAMDKSKGKAPPGLYATTIENKASWMKSGVFPCEDAGDGRPYPFTYSESDDVLLPEDYRPTKYDVINGRGKKSYNHIANRRFRQLTAMNLRRYQSAKCKNDKTLVVIGIVNSIRKSSPCGGFIKRCAKTNRWISMSDEGAREKVGHCLRDMIASQRETIEKEKQQEQLQQQQQRQRADQKNANNLALKNNNQETSSYLYASAAAAAAASASKGHALSALTAIANTLNQHNNKSSSSHNQRGGKAATSTRRSSATTSKSPRKAARFSSSRGKAYSAAAVAAATAATITIPPINGNDRQLGSTTTTTTHAPSATNAYPPHFAVAASSHFQHSGVFPHAMAEIQHIASTFNNFDYMAVTKSSGQEMSLQQRKILALLEAGFKGSVEDLIRSVQ